MSIKQARKKQQLQINTALHHAQKNKWKEQEKQSVLTSVVHVTWQEMLCVSDGSARPRAGCVSDSLHWHHSRLHGVHEGQGEWFRFIALALQQASWSPWRTRWVVPFHCTGTTAGFMESMKDKMSGSHWHYTRCHGVDERQGEWVRSIALVQQQTSWSRWNTVWLVSVHCTGTTASFMESMKDKVSGSIPLHWHHSRLHGVDERPGERFHFIALAPQQTSWSWWKTRWVVPFHDKVGGSIPSHWHHSRLHGVDKRQGEWFHFIALAPQQASWSRWKTR